MSDRATISTLTHFRRCACGFGTCGGIDPGRLEADDVLEPMPRAENAFDSRYQGLVGYETLGRRSHAAFAFASALSLAACSAANAPAPAEAPLRVASLNLCTDELLLSLADPEQIVSVTHLAQQEAETPLWREAGRYQRNDGSLVSAARHRPDLVVTMGGGARDRLRIAAGLGIRTLDLPFAQSLDDVERAIRTVALALGNEARGEVLIARIETLKRSVPVRSADTIWLGGGGRTVSALGLEAQWMRLAGLAQRPLQGDQRSLEQLAARPPAILSGATIAPGYSASHRWLGHPLASATERSRSVPPRTALDLHGSADDRRGFERAARGATPLTGRVGFILALLLVAAASLSLACRGAISPPSLRRIASLPVDPRRAASPAHAPRIDLWRDARRGGRRGPACSRNPSPRPDLTGTTSGAALGAVVTAYLFGFSGPLALSLGAVAGAMAALLLLLALAGPRAETATLLLAGLAISALAGALTTLALALAPSPFAFYDAYDWLMGSLVDRSLTQTAFAGVPAAIAILLLLRLARPLDALALGEEVAQSMGHDIVRLRRQLVCLTAVGVGACVAICGAIGFIGLVAPIFARRLTGGHPGRAILPAAMIGALLLAVADLAVRAAPLGRTLPIGVLTALLGAPFFLWLVGNMRWRIRR